MIRELIKFWTFFDPKHKQIIIFNAHLHGNQQTYIICANMQIKIIIFRFGQISSGCLTTFSSQYIHHQKGYLISYKL